MLIDDADMEVVECYTTSDRAYKYTAIVLKKKVRHCAMVKMMATLLTKHGIDRKSLVGCDSITSDSKKDSEGSIKDNVAFRWIVRDKDLKKSCYEEWIAEGRKKSIVHDFKEKQSSGCPDISSMSKATISRMFETMFSQLSSAKTKLQETEQVVHSVRSDNDTLTTSNRELSDRCKLLEEQLESANSIIASFNEHRN